MNPGALIVLYELDTGAEKFYFHNGMNELKEDITFNAIPYKFFPMEASGFEFRGNEGLPRPTFTVTNVDGTAGKIARMYGDLLGSTFTRRRTLAKYLDAVNFTDGNPTADPTMQLDPDVFIIEQKSYEDHEKISWTCTSPMDLVGVMIPARVVSNMVCPFRYKGSECGYTGALPGCDKGLATTNGCKVHFPTGTIPFGGFPGVGRGRSLGS